MIDAAYITTIANDRPRWVSLTSNQRLPLPTTFTGRIAYSLDLLTSMRGVSWYSDRRWDFTTTVVASRQARLTNTSRVRFLWTNVPWFILYLLMIDTIDTYVKYVGFDMKHLCPVSGNVPWYHQMISSVTISIWTYLAIAGEHTMFALIFVGLGLTRPYAWPHMFDYPLFASTLPEFWGRRWHYIYRRVFDRLLVPFLPPPLPASTHHHG